MMTYGSITSGSSSGAMLLSSSASSMSEGGRGSGSPSVGDGGGSGSHTTSHSSIDASLSVTTRGAQEQLQHQDPRRPPSPTSSTTQHHSFSYPDEHTSLPQNYAPDCSDPLSFFLASGRGDSDPFGFGVGSVADGTFGGRKPSAEELMLFRSHRLLQAEAVGVAVGPSQASSADAARVRKRFGLASAALARQVRLKVLEQTNAALRCVRALGTGASPAQQQDVINAERRTCHRMLTGVLDTATSTLREISAGCGGGSVGLSGVGMGVGMASSAFSSSLLGSPVTESQQLASKWEDVAAAASINNSNGNNINSAGASSLASMRQQHQDQQKQQDQQRQQQQHQQHYQQKQQQQSIMHHMPPGMGRSSVFALTQMRDFSQHQHPSQLGAAPGGSSSSAFMGMGITPQEGAGSSANSVGGTAADAVRSFGGLSAPSTGLEGSSNRSNTWEIAVVDRSAGGTLSRAMVSSVKGKKKLVSKMSASSSEIALTDSRRSGYNNRKGSRHRLTPQAKEILEGWLAKHWLNPYPTEDEKVYLAQNCHITVTQVNNWMMNVRVRRCRTKKIGLATGPEQITYPDSSSQSCPKALTANSSGRASRSSASPAKQGGGRLALNTSSTTMVSRQRRSGTGTTTVAAAAAAAAAAATSSAASATGGGVDDSADAQVSLPPRMPMRPMVKVRKCSQRQRSVSPTSAATTRSAVSSPGGGSGGGGVVSNVTAAPWRMSQQVEPSSRATGAGGGGGQTSTAAALPV